MNTIDALWYGNLLPTESCGLTNPQLRKLLALIVTNKERLDQELDEAQKRVLNAYADSYDEYIHIQSLEAFREGFCLAAKLLTEALTQKAIYEK